MPCLLRQESDTAKPFADFFETLLTLFRFFKPTDRPTTPMKPGESLGRRRARRNILRTAFFCDRTRAVVDRSGGMKLSLSLKNDSPAAFRRETESVSFQGGFFFVVSLGRFTIRKQTAVQKTTKRRNTRANTRACVQERAMEMAVGG